MEIDLEEDLSIRDWIRKYLFTKRGLNIRVSRNDWWERHKVTDRLKQIFDETVFLENVSLICRIYHVSQNLKEIPHCIVCGKNAKFVSFKNGYLDTCSRKCSVKSPIRCEKIKKAEGWKKAQEINKKKNIEKYGVETPLLLPDFQEEMRKKKLEKYGCLNANREKSIQTNIDKYGVRSLFMLPEHQEKLRESKKQKYKNGVINYNGPISKDEKELLEFLNSLGYEFKSDMSILGNLQIDAYNEELKLGIEYCGLYFHSERFKKSNYHINKMKKCNEAGVRLITIFEDEWKLRKEQVKDFLKSTIGVFSSRIHARKCEFKEIDKKEAKIFLQENHIQGFPNTIKKSFALLYNNEIVGVVSYSMHHRNSSILVLNRLAFKKDIQVIGGVSKLIKNSLQEMNEDVITWSDNRWSEGTIYKNNGFVLEEKLREDYSYVMDTNKFLRCSKQSCNKKKNNIPIETTEKDYWLSKGVYRIWDCGKIRWKYSKKEENGN